MLRDNNDYRKLIGMILYLATNSRPDISASVSILSQKVTCPTLTDMNELKRTIRYLKGTRSHQLMLSNALCEQSLQCFTDANFAEDQITRKSNSGFVCFLNGGAVSWCCRRQDIVAQSSTEAEFIALSEACKELLWLQKLVKAFDVATTEPLTDSQSSIKLVENDRYSSRTKHIDTRYKLATHLVANGSIILKYIETENNIADIFTKPLASIKTKHFVKLLNLID